MIPLLLITITSGDAPVAPYVPCTFEAQLLADLDAFVAPESAAEDLDPFMEVCMGFGKVATVGATTFNAVLEREADGRSPVMHCKESDAEAYLSAGTQVSIGGDTYYVEQYARTDDGMAVVQLRLAS